MKDNFTRIAVILDRSGSMEMLRQATVSGFNEFIAEQRKLPGEMRVKLVQFDSEYEVVFDKNLHDVPTLTQEMFVPRGSTALLDAQGRTIRTLGEELAALPEAERPSKVIVMTITDGLENASKEYNRHLIAAMVQDQREKYNWEFMYLGANQDAVAVAAAMNIPMGSTMTYAATGQGMGNTMRAAAYYVNAVRATGQAVFTEEERKKAMAGQQDGDVA